MFIPTLPSRVAAVFAAVLAILIALPSAAASRSHAPASAQAASGYERREDVRAFIDALVRDDGFSRSTLRRWFRDVRYQPKIVEAMDRPIAAPPNLPPSGPRLNYIWRCPWRTSIRRR